MDLAHLHLMLNHFPVIGTIIGFGLLGYALFVKSEDLKRFSLGVFLIMALLAIPVYLSGYSAQESIAGSEGVSLSYVEMHQDAALLALVFMMVTGGFAWLGLWQYRRFTQPASWTVPVVLLSAVVTMGFMARAANTGGEIRHPEIRYTQQPPIPEGSVGWSGTIATWVTSDPWVWPAAEAIHFLGMALLIGVVLLVNLRMLGVVKGLSYAAVHRLLPWGLLGFAVNVATGMLFFITAPEQYTLNVPMQLKLLLMMIGGVSVLYFTLSEEPWTLRAGDDAPTADKAMAAFTILLWVGVIYFGRMMPFMGISF